MLAHTINLKSDKNRNLKGFKFRPDSKKKKERKTTFGKYSKLEKLRV